MKELMLKIEPGQFCISFLEQTAPELVGLLFIRAVDKTTVGEYGQIVIDNDIVPFSELPKSKMKKAIVSGRVECLLWWYNKLKNHWTLRDHGYGRNEPTISQIALVQIETRGASN